MEQEAYVSKYKLMKSSSYQTGGAQSYSTLILTSIHSFKNWKL